MNVTSFDKTWSCPIHEFLKRNPSVAQTNLMDVHFFGLLSQELHSFQPSMDKVRCTVKIKDEEFLSGLDLLQKWLKPDFTCTDLKRLFSDPSEEDHHLFSFTVKNNCNFVFKYDWSSGTSIKVDFDIKDLCRFPFWIKFRAEDATPVGWRRSFMNPSESKWHVKMVAISIYIKPLRLSYLFPKVQFLWKQNSHLAALILVKLQK